MFKIGSCRIDSQPYLFNHVHNTKQILITLNYLLKNENRELYDNIHMKPLSMNVINIIITFTTYKFIIRFVENITKVKKFKKSIYFEQKDYIVRCKVIGVKKREN